MVKLIGWPKNVKIVYLSTRQTTVAVARNKLNQQLLNLILVKKRLSFGFDFKKKVLRHL